MTGTESQPAREPGFESVRAAEPLTLVILGATGDLAQRKLLPALMQLEAAGYLPDRYAVLGAARSPFSDEAFREQARRSLPASSPVESRAREKLLRVLFYQSVSADDEASFKQVAARLAALEADLRLPGHRLFYLSVAPQHFAPILRGLRAAKLLHPAAPGEGNPHSAAPAAPPGPWSRVIFEKPYGRDLDSARALNHEVGAILDESQVYRIDHFLGKETVQNLLTFRFANAIFEPLFNQKYVDHLQITAAETQGLEGRRGAYYDSAGAIRDMVQNHLLQLLALTALEPPPAFEAHAIRDEKVKVFRALVPFDAQDAGMCSDVVIGRYGPGRDPEGRPVKGYLEEAGVRPDSATETYAALRLRLENWRWAGVPIFLRTGKRLSKRVTEIAVQFRQPPLNFFRELPAGYCLLPPRPGANLLLFRIQPEEGIRISFVCKEPGMRVALRQVNADFGYSRTFDRRSPEAYERLLLDACRGDQSLFTRSDEVEYAWRFVSSVHAYLEKRNSTPVEYAPFSEGPAEARNLWAGASGAWRRLEDL